MPNASEARDLEEAIEADLRALAEFEGLRTDPPFAFRNFKRMPSGGICVK